MGGYLSSEKHPGHSDTLHILFFLVIYYWKLSFFDDSGLRKLLILFCMTDVHEIFYTCLFVCVCV